MSIILMYEAWVANFVYPLRIGYGYDPYGVIIYTYILVQYIPVYIYIYIYIKTLFYPLRIIDDGGASIDSIKCDIVSNAV